MKKILSLALALILTLSAFVLPASAAVPSEETVEPYAVIIKCPACGGQARRITTYDETGSWPANTCANGNPSHWHYEHSFYYVTDCTSCTYYHVGDYLYTRTYCEGIGSYV